MATRKQAGSKPRKSEAERITELQAKIKRLETRKQIRDLQSTLKKK